MSPPAIRFGADWIVAYFDMVDRRDVEEFLSWYHPDASFRFANQPPAIGAAAIGATLLNFYELIESMHHERTGLWCDADSGAFEATAHFVTKDGRTVDLPAISTLRIRDGLVHAFTFVMDATPITATNHDG